MDFYDWIPYGYKKSELPKEVRNKGHSIQENTGIGFFGQEGDQKIIFAAKIKNKIHKFILS